ncbi:MAG: MoxR-like ATPase, partial [Mycobacterium sp.]|nr:MoxR-like ATPase [Mycobacterium sp.]
MTSPSGPPQGAGGFPGQGLAQGFGPGPQQGPPNNGGLQGEVHTLERAIFEVKR